MLADGGKHLTHTGTSDYLDPAFEEAGTRTELQGQGTVSGGQKGSWKGGI